MIKKINLHPIKNSLTSFLVIVFTIVTFCSCTKDQKSNPTKKLFTSITAKNSGVHFENKIIESDDFYYYQYIYSYNGGGVATADFNNDGLQDLFFVSNLEDSKLYINLGDFKFKDITSSSGISTKNRFNTGVSVVDINNDGFLDIYVSRAGWFKDAEKCANLLYINNGDLSFTEQAKAYGLADINRSIQTSFFDFDKDGDLDVYIVNAPYSNKRLDNLVDLNSIKNDSKTKALGGSDTFYENLGNNTFVNISEKAGIVPDIAFGLNAQVGDLNNDGWLDVYVNNDFSMPDFAYINNQDGTFTDKSKTMFKHQSFYSMGGDVGDINNDGLFDMIALDMNPEDYIRSKTTMSMMSIDKFWTMVNNGYQYQYMHNVLQLNNGNGTFSDIANMAGVANTDWSWSSLLADFDLDGYNDIYVTNGVFRDVIDKDASKKILDLIKQKGKRPTPSEFFKYTQMLPQQKLSNYLFKNNGDLTFSNTTSTWANMKPTFSNGAVYTDLDNDGDLDIVVNNINEPASVLKNNAIELNKGHFLKIQFNGPENNPFGLGVKLNLFTDKDKVQTRQLINARGYMSSVSNTLHFGLGDVQNIDKIDVIWPDGKTQQLENIKSNQLLTINYSDITSYENKKGHTAKTLFKKAPFNYQHKDSVFDDFNIQILLPHKLSQLGPAIAKSDINNDGIDDLYLGGGYLQSGQLLIGLPSGGFKSISTSSFNSDAIFEDTGAVFFDLENDGDQDLYVVSGSYEFGEESRLLQDRIYVNNGNDEFIRCDNCLPEFYSAGSVVVPSDYDGDGDTDLFVGGRVIPGRYPYAPKSYLLVNNNGVFTNQTTKLAKTLQHVGMVTDAHWTDIDNDKDFDLIVTGEWMGIEVFENNKGKLKQSKAYHELSAATGWWNKLLIVDIDDDGDHDIVAGNLGLNSKFHASRDTPFEVYTSDFDQNGTEDVFLAKYYNGKQVPVRGKGCSSQQIPQLNSKIKSYNEFANKDLEGILGAGIKSALHYKALEFRSGIFINNNDSKFTFEPFVNEVQTSAINSMLYEDLDNDGFKDLLLAGNNHQTEVETTRLDAGVGIYLQGNREGAFKYVPNYKTGFFADKDVRNIIQIETSTGKHLIVINNNSAHDFFKIIPISK